MKTQYAWAVIDKKGYLYQSSLYFDKKYTKQFKDTFKVPKGFWKIIKVKITY